MRLARPFAIVTLVLASTPFAGCGGGGGGGDPSLFPAGVTPQDLVAVAFDDVTLRLPRLSLADVKGRGEAILQDLVIADGGSIDDLVWSPDHGKLAVLAQPDGVVDSVLYVVEPLTGTVTPVSGPQTPGSYVERCDWSPDSSRLAFVRNGALADTLSVVRPDGSGLVEVSGPLVAGGNVGDFAWSPDSTRLAFRADADVDDQEEQFVVNRDGSARVKVSGTIVSGGGIDDFRWSPDSSRLGLLGRLGTTAAAELFTVLADGTGSRARVHPGLASGGNVVRFEWAPDASRLAYVADQGADETFELYASLPDGTGNVKLSGTIVAGGDVERRFFWAPSSARVAFVADRLTDEVRELFTVPGIGGTPPIRVSGTMIADGDVAGFSFAGDEIHWSPDSTRIAYVADQEVDGAEHLYVTHAFTAAPTRVTPTPTGLVETSQIQWAPDSAALVFFFFPGAETGVRVSGPDGPSSPVVVSVEGQLLPKFVPLSFTGDRVVCECDEEVTHARSVRSYDLVTRSEAIVSEPNVRASGSLRIE